jgi:hypothetical protein
LLFFQEGDANTPHTFWIQKPAAWAPGGPAWTVLNLNTNFQSANSETLFCDAGTVYTRIQNLDRARIVVQ